MPSKSAGLKNGQSQTVVRLLCIFTKLDSVDSNEEEPIGDLVVSTAIGRVQAGDLVSHTTPSFAPR